MLGLDDFLRTYTKILFQSEIFGQVLISALTFDLPIPILAVVAKKASTPQVIAIVGAQWGDEGKGKIVDFLSSDADVVIRAQGGDNAGHTVSNFRGKFALHLIPAGIFNPKTINIIGAGVALNPQTLKNEIEGLVKRGVSIKNLKISPKAHLAFDYHLFLDRVQEDSRGDRKIETTKRGIGPTYMDKAERVGLPAKLLLDPNRLLKDLEVVLDKKSKMFAKGLVPDEFKVGYYEKLIKQLSKMLSSMIVDTDQITQTHLSKGSKFVIEGAHGALLDLDHGTYPYVTASNCSVAGLLSGAGMPPLKLTKVVGVFKAYQTRVGAGGMPTELKNAQGDLIREKGHEYGTTTGRPRRIGYFDGVAARYATLINGFTDIAITRLDTLSGTGELKIASGYKRSLKENLSSELSRFSYKQGSKILSSFPVDDQILSSCQGIYKREDQFRGWDEDFSKAKKFTDLPKEAQRYCLAVAKNIPGAKLSYIGIGEKREDLIVL